jgi:hypothetical protein
VVLPPRVLFLLALVALWWPGRLTGIFDGAPFDTAADAVVLGLLLPILLWLTPAAGRDRRIQVLVLALLAWKIFSSAALVQEGLCARVEVPGRAAAVKNWDVRTDWLSPDPRCSAIADRPYLDERRLPIWLPFSFPDPTAAAPVEPDASRVIARVTITGTIDAAAGGVLRVWRAPTVDAWVQVDGRPAAADGAAVGAGLHHIAIEAVLRDRNWILAPLWSDADLFAALPVTVTPPSALDVLVRPWGGWLTFALVLALLLAAAAHAVRAIAGPQLLTWVALSAAAGALVPWLVPERRWHYVMLLLLAACAVRMPERWRGGRGLFLLLAPWWLAMTVVDTYRDQGFGRLDFITPGNDWWTFQIYAYRIYMDGFWLQGGEPAFWYQPFYRWIAGALHMLFGQSQVGENYWDALAMLAPAIFSFEVVRRVSSARWGVAAAAMVLIAFVSGPGFIFIGRGLSEISSAAFIYLAALLVMRAREARSIRLLIVAGCFAVLGTWTRLNNLPMALGIIAFAWPIGEPVRTLWTPRKWFATAWHPALLVVPAIVAIGMTLFAWRTWYYTGHFSVFYGTQSAMLRIWKAGMPLGEVARQMLDSVLMVATTADPPAYHNGALPIIAGFALSIAALSGAGWLGRLPLPLIGFTLSAFAGALIARGTAYSGRFSVHVVGATVAVVMCAIAAMAPSLYRFNRGTNLVRPWTGPTSPP